MNLRRDHGSDNQFWILYIKMWGRSRNWVSWLSLFRRGDEQSEAEDIFARKASVPQEEGALCSCVAVFWVSVGSIAYLLLVFSVVPLETVHPVRTI